MLYPKGCQPGYTLQNTISNGFACLCDDGVLIEACMEENIVLKVSRQDIPETNITTYISLYFSMGYGLIILDLSYSYTSALLATVGVIMKVILENTVVYPFIELAMKVYSVIATEKASENACIHVHTYKNIHMVTQISHFFSIFRTEQRTNST